MENQTFIQRNMKWLVIVLLLVILVVWGFGKYNSFITMNESITSQWAQVDNQLQRRYDLIPNIVATVKGVAKQEQTVFGEIADARTRYSGATTPDAKAAAATQVEGALARLLVIAENYPTLQSSQAYRDLIVSLEGTENRISVERKNYNDLVRDLNASIKRFPNSIIASIASVHERTYFEVSDTAKENPKVDFSN